MRKLAVLVSCFTILLGTFPVIGQPVIPTPISHPDGPPIYEEPEGAIIEDMERWHREYLDFFANRTIFDFRVAYLIRDNAITSDTVSPETFNTYLGAVNIASWDAFLEENTLNPFHIVIVHASMLEDVDSEWLSEAYRNRVIVLGINLTIAQLANLVGDQCDHRGMQSPSLVRPDQDVFTGSLFMVEAETEAIRDFVIESELETCIKDYQGLGRVEVRNGIGETRLGSVGEIEYLAIDLAWQTAEIGLPKPTP